MWWWAGARVEVWTVNGRHVHSDHGLVVATRVSEENYVQVLWGEMESGRMETW